MMGALGVVAAIDPTNGAGPFYTVGGSLTEVEAEATGVSGTPPLAIFTNVEPGIYTFSATMDEDECLPFFGGDPVDVEVFADTLSVVVMSCPM